LRNKKALVMSPHGAFNPLQLQHSAWKKRLVGWMDRWLLRRASVVHATCEAENAWVEAFLERKEERGKRKEGNTNIQHSTSNIEHPIKKKPRIVVIPNGVGE
jgi:hypothetical protein